MSLIDEDGDRRVRMAYLSVVGSHGQRRGASCIRELMRETIFADFAQLWPERFTNVTNGIAVRRWLKQANPGLVRAADRAAGLGVGKRSRGARAPEVGRGRCGFPRRFREIKRANKQRLATTIERCCGIGGQRRCAVRRAGQAHPRIQAAAAEPAVRRGALPAHPATTATPTSCRAWSSSPARPRPVT